MATSRELLTAREKGAKILHNGAPVAYLPRRPGDRMPWVRRGYRYTAAECQVYWPAGKEE